MLNEDSVTGQVAMDDGRITGVKITAYQEKKKKKLQIHTMYWISINVSVY